MCIPEQEPTEAIWYMKIVIFLYPVSVSLFSICGGLQQGTTICKCLLCFLFFIFVVFITFRWVWIIFGPCSSLILLGKNKCCIVKKITCCFLWMSKTLCRWRTRSIRHKFYSVRACACPWNLKGEKKIIQDGRARCRNNYSYSVSFSIRLDIF